MPAFDPVRDAVLNSPVDQHPPQTTYSPIASPSLTRRATDLSVLLNSSEPPIPARSTTATSSASSSSSLSNILSNQAEDKLTTSEPLIRRYTSSSSRSTQVAYPSPATQGSSSPTRFHHNYQDMQQPARGPHPPTPTSAGAHASSRPSSSSSSTAPSASRLGGSVGNGVRQTSSPSMRPPPTPPPPTSAKDATNPKSATPAGAPIKTSSIPYRPTKRITPAQSVLIPLSQQEMEMFRNYRGQGAQRLAMKRKRSGSEDDADARPAKRPAGDVDVVVEHYNSRPDVGVVQRQDSPIIGLKNFNNWVKSVLITRYAHPALQKSVVAGYSGRGGRGKVLDMGCGKGGDMTKWSKAQVRELFCVDIAAVSVEQARARYESMRNSRFEALFAALDCYTEPLHKAFPTARLAPPFDVVSMQFCMHYAFETVQKARCMLENVSRYLRSGGVFIGTIPNSDLLYAHLDAIPPDAEELSFGNSVYKIRFEQRDSRPTFGHKYWFFLQDAVENVPEYVVPWDDFVELAAEYDLYPTCKEEFHQVFAQNQDIPEFKNLMVRMKVVDANGESSMDEDQWEAANIYIAFAFEKR
ncbi:mRNA capping methyltransferase [Coprinopsis cinerea okayama7|uniref:mRNA cap guanine-N(7) methyltransferase n=1 Tax=Coprinopsis cinerea (strain Okayama-7 / 130 / ATCC MYA-4618 / FGSC 9003) TaxID=240176 RepID=A8NGX2_COPC7|nr:mRNA capping methyltransferase [Coprinopsis cinerea okayama7\|eukprot:XP_001833621.2 mRNA capping methyltransferase [Coprinopsis cinerea okayama7\